MNKKATALSVLSGLFLTSTIVLSTTSEYVANASYYEVGDVYVRTGKEAKNWEKLKKSYIKFEKLDAKLKKFNEKHKYDSMIKSKVEKHVEICNAITSCIDSYMAIKKNAESEGDFAIVACVNNILTSLTAIANCCGPYGQIVGAVIGAAQSIAKLIIGGQEPTDAMTQLEDRMDQQFDEIKDDLANIEEEICELANEINSASDRVISELSNKIDQTVASEHVREFKNRGTGNFSYNEFHNCLYGDDDRAYCNILKGVQESNASNETIKEYYDLVYQTLYEDTDIFYDYVLPEDGKSSIVRYYYDFISADDSLELADAEYETIKFAYDLYQTALRADQQLLSCNLYQYMDIYQKWVDTNSKKTGFDVNNFYKENIFDLKYDYGTGTMSLYQMEELQKRIDVREDALITQLAQDIAYVLSINDSYMIQCGKDIYEINDTGDSFGNVSSNQTIYLSQFPNELFTTFGDFRREDFSYKFTNKEYVNEYHSSIDTSTDYTVNGIFEIKEDNKNVVASLYYKGTTELTSSKITFSSYTNGNMYDFYGGDGSEESPYLIGNASQFKRINEDLSKHYRLIDDVDFKNSEIYSFGFDINSNDNPVFKEFTGSLDGNGYTISNLKINGNIQGGLFASIGDIGEVMNLNMNFVSSSIDLYEVKKSDSKFYAGIIAGINNGKITNCKLTNSSLSYNMKNETTNRCITVYAGGICGENNNLISCCSIGATIDVNSSHKFGGDKTDDNKQKAYVGGICGQNNSQMINSLVTNETSVKSTITSRLSPQDTVNAYTYSYAGIFAGANNSLVQNIFAEEGATSKGTSKIEHYDSRLYPGTKNKKESQNNANIGTVNNNDFVTNNTLNKEKLISQLNSLVISNNVFTYSYEDKKDIPYDVSEINFHTDGLNIYCNGNKVDSYKILMTYGFDTYNKDFFEIKKKVSLLISATIGNDTVYGIINDIPVTINPNTVTYIIEDFDETIQINDAYSFIGSKIKVDYAIEDGVSYYDTTIEITGDNIDKIEFIGNALDTSTLGKKQVQVVYKATDGKVYELKIAESQDDGTIIYLDHLNIEVVCQNTFENNSNHYHLVENECVKATCITVGKNVYACDECDEKYIEYIPKTLGHDFIEVEHVDPICEKNGYIKYKCKDCGFIKIEEIVKLGHNYEACVNESQHECTRCHNIETHQYTVKETQLFNNDSKAFELYYEYHCEICDHSSLEPDKNYIVDGEYPIVVVSDSYALNYGETLKVYIQLENNPGIDGAVFGVRYSKYLTLIDIEEGGKDFVFYNAVGDKYVNVSGNKNIVDNDDLYDYSDITFVWSSYSTSYVNGNIMVLTFKLPDVAPTDSNTSEEINEFDIKVVYGDIIRKDINNNPTTTKCGFLHKNERYKFMAKAGTIRVLDEGDYLPGDVDKNGKVDLLDVLLMNKYLIQDGSVTIDESIGNVDASSDGVQINDSYRLLQSLTGNESLIKSDYDIILNTNGTINENINSKVHVDLYEEYDIVKKSYYGKYHDLPTPTRNGYTFKGWYTTLSGIKTIDNKEVSSEVKNGDHVVYNNNQMVQALYALWEINKVVFVDEKDNVLKTEYYNSNNEEQSFIEVFSLEESTKEIFIFDQSGNKLKDSNGNEYNLYLHRNFIYWSNENGEKIESINLASSGVVKVVSYCEYSLTNYGQKISLDEIKPKKEGYSSDIVFKEDGTNTTFKNLQELYYSNKSNIFTNDTIIEFKISFDMNGGTYNNPNEYENEKWTLSNPYRLNLNADYTNQIYRTGYTFVRFDVLVNGNTYDSIIAGEINNKIGKIANAAYLTNGVYIGYIDGVNYGDTVTIKAVWSPNTYVLTIKGIDENSTYNSGLNYDVLEFGKLYYKYEVGYYTNEDCSEESKVDCIPESIFTDKIPHFEALGLYRNITDNGHTDATLDGDPVIGEDHYLNNYVFCPDETLYVYCCPKEYTVSFGLDSEGILENARITTATYQGYNLTIVYNGITREYKFTNNLESIYDPHADIGQYVYLEAGKEYYVHLDINNIDSNNPKGVQLFYALGLVGEERILNFAEETSTWFNKDNTLKVIKVDETGNYRFRMDNDTEENITISNFWIELVSDFEPNVTYHYNEQLPELSKTPKSSLYKDLYYIEYRYNGKVYYDKDGNPKIADFGSGVTLTAKWVPIRSDINYIITWEDLRDKARGGNNCMLLCDIDLSGINWNPQNYYGDFDGNGKTIYGLTFSTTANNGNSTASYGLFYSLSNGAHIHDLIIDHFSAYFDPNHDGTGRVYAGAVAGFTNEGTVKIARVTVKNSSIVIHRDNSTMGGFVGESSPGLNIDDSIVNGLKLYGNGDEAGFVGVMYSGSITNCKAYSLDVDHYPLYNAKSIGGFVGYCKYSTIKYSAIYNSTMHLKTGGKKETRMGYIFGHITGGEIYSTGKDNCSYSKESGANGKYFFTLGWGYGGLMDNNPIIH